MLKRLLSHLESRTRQVTDRPTAVAVGTWARVVDAFNALELSENTILISFAVLVGVLGAGGVIVFYKLIDLAYTVFYRWPGEMVSRSVFLGYRPLLTALGLMLAWIVMRRLGRDHDGLNVPDVQLSVARRAGFIPTRPALARTAASAVTMGAGGSAGSEGPVAVLGSTIGSQLGRLFRFDSSRVKVLVGAGAAAGISAAFNAPLAGAFFALEEILGTFTATAFAPVVVSSVMAALVSRAFFGNHPAFPIPREYSYQQSAEILVLYPLLGVVCALVAVLFIRTFFRIDRIAARVRQYPLLLAGVAGALIGLMVYASGGTLVGYGHLAVRLEVFGRMAWYTLALLALGKILATSITLNCGGSGGVFTPALFVGAATGGAFGVVMKELFPALQLSPEAFALVGMGALVAAATDAPITGILIVFEMTNDYAIMPALMLVVAICTVIARKIEPESLYSGWLHRRGQYIKHGTDRELMASLRVSDAFEPVSSVRDTAQLAEILEHLGRGSYTDLPVIRSDGTFAGMITLADLTRLAKEQDNLEALIIAADVVVSTETAAPADSLLSINRRMGVRGVGALPVLDGNGRLLGMITRSNILAAYERSAAELP
jgi:CIC family chloride channel protein